MSDFDKTGTGEHDTPLLCEVDGRGVATVTLNRPKVHNAFDERLIAALTETLARLDQDPSLRAVVLRGAGKSFSAGADLNWMGRMAGYSDAENIADARGLALMLKTVDTMTRPVVAAIHGNCFGGAIGLVSCADIAVAADDAVFSLSEVRLGLAPATIAPYVIRAMGPRMARRYVLTGERFGANTALRLGLVHEAVPASGLAEAVEGVISALLSGSVEAQRRSKALVAAIANSPLNDELIDTTVRLIAEIRATPEAREGLSAFFEKRKPRWVPDV